MNLDPWKVWKKHNISKQNHSNNIKFNDYYGIVVPASSPPPRPPARFSKLHVHTIMQKYWKLGGAWRPRLMFTHLLSSASAKKLCLTTLGSRFTEHFSMSGRSTLGNIKRASCSLLSASVGTGSSLVGMSLLLLEDEEWNRASGMENAKFGSWDRFRWLWNGNEID